MNLAAGEIYSFKLQSGEELIAKVQSFDATSVNISEPVSVAPGPQGMGLIPSMFTADIGEVIRLNTSGIIMWASTELAVKNKYIEATTGIKLPEKKLILG